MLRINLLGAPAIDVEGEPLAVDTRKATALAAYLAVEGGVHSRDSLACLFWPDYAQERSRAALRRTLSTLRTAVGGETLVVDRDAVSLERSRLVLDIDEFRRRAAAPDAASLEAAVALHRGPFMAGFSIRDSAPFDDWQSFNSSTLARELGGRTRPRCRRPRSSRRLAARDRTCAETARTGRTARARAPAPDAAVRGERRAERRVRPVPGLRPRAAPRARGGATRR